MADPPPPKVYKLWQQGPHPGGRAHSWAIVDGIAYVYDANGKQLGFGPVDQVKHLFEVKDG